MFSCVPRAALLYMSYSNFDLANTALCCSWTTHQFCGWGRIVGDFKWEEEGGRSATNLTIFTLAPCHRRPVLGTPQPTKNSLEKHQCKLPVMRQWYPASARWLVTIFAACGEDLTLKLIFETKRLYLHAAGFFFCGGQFLYTVPSCGFYL